MPGQHRLLRLSRTLSQERLTCAASTLNLRQVYASSTIRLGYTSTLRLHYVYTKSTQRWRYVYAKYTLYLNYFYVTSEETVRLRQC